MKQTLKITLCLVLALLCLTQPVLAVGTSTNTTAALQPSTAEILNAVEPLVEAQAEYYDFRHISVENVATTVTSSGAVETTCTVVFTMTLKADSVEELPHVAGMLSELNMESVAECYAAVANTNVATMNSTQLATYNIQAQSVAQIEAYAEYIGEETTIAFGILLVGDSTGNITQVLGVGEVDENGSRYTFPLSGYFPETEETMFQNGANAVRDVIAQVADTMALSSDIGNAYDRIGARNYAMTWSSEAPYNSTCPHGDHYIDLSAYNPAYHYHCHQDCANFVSQALRAGGIPTDGTWYPDEDCEAWNYVPTLYTYMYSTKGHWQTSSYASCNAGGVIVNRTSSGGRPHINMCVLNDTVNRAYAAHNADHNYKAYSLSYWSVAPDFYTVFMTGDITIMSVGER